MKVKSCVVVSLVAIGIILVFVQQPCQASRRIEQLRKSQEQVVEKAREQIGMRADASYKTELATRRPASVEDVIEPSEMLPAAPLTLIERIDRVLGEEDIKPEEIAAIRDDLSKLKESVAETDALEHSFDSTINKLDEIFKEAAKDNDKVTLWRNVTSSGFVLSVVGLVGCLRRMSSVKLDGVLKKLQIAEKRAKFEQDGIDPEKYF